MKINIGIVMIATNKYLDLWKTSVASLMENNKEYSEKVTIHLFTDQPDDAENFWKSHSLKGSLKIHKIPPYVWPEATLLRYQIIDKGSEELAEDLLMYLDSDMLVSNNFLKTLHTISWENGIAVVAHPGFYRPIRKFAIRERITNPFLLIQDLKHLIRFRNGFGSWETNPVSSAYVNRKMRKVYVHGAIWMGPNVTFKKLVHDLAFEVQKDLEKEYIAIWHDESHLNSWITRNRFTLLPPSYSWYSEYRHLRHLKPLVESMNKAEISFERITNE